MCLVFWRRFHAGEQFACLLHVSIGGSTIGSGVERDDGLDGEQTVVLRVDESGCRIAHLHGWRDGAEGDGALQKGQ